MIKILLCLLVLAAAGPVRASDLFAQVGNLHVHYTVTGDGDALVFCHGGYQDLHMWALQETYFSKSYKVVLIDLPGHGQTTGVDTNVLAADVIRSVMDTLRIRKATIIGLSMGAACATDFALDYPDRVAGLIVVSPGLSGWPLVMKMDTLSKQLFDKMIRIQKTGDHALFAEGFAAVWCVGPYRKVTQVDQQVWNYVYTTTLNNHTPDNGWPVYDTNYAARRIKDIACPVLIIRGDKDIPFIVQVTDYYKQQLPKATLITITNVAHMLNMEKPAEFNRVVAGWLSGEKGRVNPYAGRSNVAYMLARP